MKYNKISQIAKEFINDEEIMKTLYEARVLARDQGEISRILQKALEFKGLTYKEAAVLSYVESKTMQRKMFDAAARIKQYIYGDRIVMFASLTRSCGTDSAVGCANAT
jgi:2-iminoacetate synthase